MAEAAAAAAELREALAALGLTRSYQADGEQMSTISVWSNLVIWCAGEAYFWRTGHDFSQFASHPIDDPAGAAVSIHARYVELREQAAAVSTGHV